MTNSILRGSAFAHAVSLQVAVVAGPWAKCSASLQPGPAGHIVEAFRETLFLSLSLFAHSLVPDTREKGLPFTWAETPLHLTRVHLVDFWQC